MVKGKQRVNLYLRPELVEEGKIKAIKDHMSFSRLVENSIVFYLSKYAEKTT